MGSGEGYGHDKVTKLYVRHFSDSLVFYGGEKGEEEIESE